MIDDVRRPGVGTQTVASSTWQYPDGTMSVVVKRAAEKGWPVRSWCYKETGNPHDGWLSLEQIERKRTEISSAMWETEYDLQEPSIEGRAFDTEAVQRYFNPALGTYEGRPDEEIILAEPEPGARYVHGADWAKEKDWTVIRTFRTDVRPWQEVAFLRTGRKPWGALVNHLIERWHRYGGHIFHDNTGLGDVVDDLISERMADDRVVHPIQMVGRTREEMFSEYGAAIEQGELETARIEYAYNEHRYARHEDFRPGRAGHPPDSCVAGALAWHGRHKSDWQSTVPPDVDSFAVDESPWSI